MAEGLEERKAEKVDTVAAGEGEAPKRERRRVRRNDNEAAEAPAESAE
jgi:small subunit ribosomal protein S2